MVQSEHPLLATLTAAASGRLPVADGKVEVLPPPPGPVQAIVAFTGHHVVAADVDEIQVQARLGPADLGGPMSADFQLWLSGWLGCPPASHDLVLTAGPAPAPVGPVELRPADHLSAHPRVLRASRYRTDVQVFAAVDGNAVVVLGRGLAGRWEVAFEVEPAARDRGLGRRVAAAAAGLLSPGTALFAQVAPGNAASLRCLLAAGYVPIGGEVLYPTGRR